MKYKLRRSFILMLILMLLSGCFAGSSAKSERKLDSQILSKIRNKITADYKKNPRDSKNIYNYAILNIVASPDISSLHLSIQLFDEYLAKKPEDLAAQMYNGYALVLAAELYQKQKNYFKAAEYSKKGFYLMDEAVDQAPDNITLRLIRSRFDSQTPQEVGRYVLAIKDLKYLLANKDKFPAAIEPLIYFLLAKAYLTAGDAVSAEMQQAILHRQFPEQSFSRMPLNKKMVVTDEEIQAIFRP